MANPDQAGQVWRGGARAHCDLAVVSSSTVACCTCQCYSSKHCTHFLITKLGLYPYRLQVNKKLSGADQEKRVVFARMMMENNIDLENVLWTDESYFSLSGPKLCVCSGYSARHRLQTFFFPATINEENYTEMLSAHVLPQLRRKRILSRIV